MLDIQTQKYGLQKTVTRKVGVYADEVAQLIGATLTRPRDGHVAIQTVCLLLLLLHTAGHRREWEWS
jgi:hypothetical protein